MSISEIETDTKLIDELLIKIPSGTVDMRDDRINKIWKVDINCFFLAKFPVTQGLYCAITKENPSAFKGHNLPVESVSWLESISFCNKLSKQLGFSPCYIINPDRETVIHTKEANGFRLPGEAEWQYACQAGASSIRYGDLDKIAWFKDNSDRSTHAVGRKAPNDWGLYDMLGNVWEWCSDIYDETVYGAYRVFRGGGWCDEERNLMATTRRRSHPVSFRIDDLGFRIARNIDEK